MNADREYLAAGCALGTLAEEELLEARALEATDPEFADEVQSFRETMGLLAESDDAIAPSAEVEARILAIPRLEQQRRTSQLHQTSQSHPAPEHHSASRSDAQSGGPVPTTNSESAATPESARRTRRRPTTTLFALAASTLLLLSAVLAGVLVNQQQDTTDMEESLTVAEAQAERAERLLAASDLSFTEAEATVGGRVTLAYSVSEQMLHLTPHDMPELPEDQTMQLWLIDEAGPRSAGLMSGTRTEMITEVAMDEGMTFGVTVEPAGGSDEPTTEPVLLADL
ncbi:anti-sigma factor [Nesterenkonia halotolerans]|uniref:Regulator of SigK n=1 Tax=Nesterenkonia halotolerans TaxID=225325 RepID=A0ABR9J6K6_9MICC|nr:anti-sigma factor [Nesterenkonia halotolerans]MBE1514614.1 anti-sigma-K factor RskA [Nesterenkonia halotolerans]